MKILYSPRAVYISEKVLCQQNRYNIVLTVHLCVARQAGRGVATLRSLSGIHTSLTVIHICYSYYKHFLSDC